MRTLSNNVKLLLSNDNVSLFYLVKIDAPGQTFRFTTAATDLDVPGIGNFESGGGLLIVDAPRLSSAVDRSIYKITFIDPEFTKRELFEAGLTGAIATVMVGFFNTTDVVLGGAQVDEPLLSTNDMIIAYSGSIDTQGYSIDPNNGTVFAVLDCASPMTTLEMSKVFFTSKEFMSRTVPADTCFDQVSVNAQKVTYLWGKA